MMWQLLARGSVSLRQQNHVVRDKKTYFFCCVATKMAEKRPNFKTLSLKPVSVLAAVSSSFQAATIPLYDMMQTHFNESLQKLKMLVFNVDFCKYKFTCVHLPPCLHDKETLRIIPSHHPLVIQVNR